jgi:hypothetical protein
MQGRGGRWFGSVNLSSPFVFCPYSALIAHRPPPTVAAEDYRLVFELLKRHLYLEVSARAKVDLDD